MIQLHHGDCLEVMKQIPDKSVDLVLTDPPYGMEFQSNFRKDKHDKIENDNNLDWLPTWLDLVVQKTKENAHIYFFCSFHHLSTFMAAANETIGIKNLLVWEKNNTSMGDLFGDYAPKYELIIFSNGNGERKLNGSRDPNILNFNRTQNENHPTEKPVEMMEYLIRKSTNENDLVLDCFMGSGSTGIAAKRTKRQFIGIEKNEIYFNTAKRRIENGESCYQMELI